jgi:hypothetical protein
LPKSPELPKLPKLPKLKLALWKMAAVLAPKEMAQAHGKPVASQLGLVFC